MIKQKKSPYFDNCPICDAMRRADESDKELTIGELRDAFENAAKSRRAIAAYINPEFRRRKQE